MRNKLINKVSGSGTCPKEKEQVLGIENGQSRRVRKASLRRGCLSKSGGSEGAPSPATPERAFPEEGTASTLALGGYCYLPLEPCPAHSAEAEPSRVNSELGIRRSGF